MAAWMAPQFVSSFFSGMPVLPEGMFRVSLDVSEAADERTQSVCGRSVASCARHLGRTANLRSRSRTDAAVALQLRSMEGSRGSEPSHPIRRRAGQGRRPTSEADHGARSASHDLSAAFTTTPSRTPFSRISSNTTLCLSVGSLEGICIATLSTPSSFGVSRSLSSSD